MLDIKDFLMWLSKCGLLQRYWKDVIEECDKNYLLVYDFINEMDANDASTLFSLLDDNPFWMKCQMKYINWRIEEGKNR